MLQLARFLLLVTAVAAGGYAQPLTRVAATSLRLPGDSPATNYSTARVFSNLTFSMPVALVSPPGDTRRLFVVEKPGRIYVIPDVTAATPTRTLFLDISSRVATSSGTNDESGLLALAFHPDYANNGQFFVWYTTNTTTGGGSGQHDRLARFRVTSDPNVADANSEQPLLTQRDEAGNHNGGQIVFGPEGYLYLSIGDEGGGDDSFQNSQRIDKDFFSAILRLDVDRRPGSLAPNAHPSVHSGTYAIPPDNPFVGATSFNGAAVNPGAVRTEFWAVGLRNPWRMAFDSATGQLWCGDVGQGAREEVDVIVRGGNYGWAYREGAVAGPRSNPPAAATFLPPIWDYPRSQGSSITGGFVYRGNRLPGLQGRYLFADFGSGRIWALAPNGTQPVSADRVPQIATEAGISSFGLDPATGDVLIADLAEGAIKRLVGTPAGGASLPATLSATGVFADTPRLVPAPGVVAYEPNVSFWSDYATKRRWFALPDSTSRFGFAPDGGWSLPSGAVWVKHFDLELTRGVPASARRIETRVLVKTTGGVYGLTYRWNDAQTDATLVPDEGAEATFTVTENGVSRPQTWHFPSRSECLSCHTPAGGEALSFNTRQLNRDYTFPGGTANIIDVLKQAGYLDVPAGTSDPGAGGRTTLAAGNDLSQPLELRARSYLEVNCAQCHQPGGTALGYWDARLATHLSAARILNGPLVDRGGDAANRVLVPGDAAHSRLLQRIKVRGPGQMPPIGTRERDLAGESLVAEWIATLASQPSSRIVNMSARGQIGTGDRTLIAGFVIRGGSKRTLMRVVGPTLGAAPINLATAAADPNLILFGPDSSTVIAGANDSWPGGSTASEMRDTASRVGAFALLDSSRDAALLSTLAPGVYTVQAGGGGGVALTEIYDADIAGNAARPQWVNISVRGHVDLGERLLILGFVIAEGGPRKLLIRAVGPGIARFGLTQFLERPTLTLYTGQQRLLANTGWNAEPNAAEIRAAAAQVGAFALDEGGTDSAMLATLTPGPYTVHIEGVDGTTGVALVEVYEAP